MNAKDKVKEFCYEVSGAVDRDNLFVKKLRSGGLKDEQIVIVIDALDKTCHHCFDGDMGCQCWNDE